MGSPLGPCLADIFLGYAENFLFNSCSARPTHYFRFVDDTWALFSNEADIYKYLNTINNVHSNLRFTIELPRDGWRGEPKNTFQHG